jgi:hypothetical protein
MKKAKKASVRKTALDRIVAQLRTMLRRETTDVILAGNLLIESRKHLEHGEWQPWLAENFDLSYRTAVNYVDAAEYAARKQKCNVAHFTSLSPTVLYALARGRYNAKEEAAIFAATREGRVDQTRAAAICETLAPPPTADDADDDDAADDDDNAEAAEAPEITAIVDGPPPDVPPPAPIVPPPDFALHALHAFDEAVTALKQLVTKPTAQFASTVHSLGDLEKVECFLRAVADRAREARS